MIVFNRYLPFVFLVFCILYMVAHLAGPFPGEEWIKTAPCLILAGIAFFRVSGWPGKVLALGFVASAIGDYLLGIWNDGTQPYFVFGLASFLIAHILYIVVFSRKMEMQKARMPVVIALVTFGVMMGIILFPKLGDLKIPVLVYMAVIIGMGVTASLKKINNPLLLLGAILFILSDSVIAVNKFLQEVPYAFFLIMITYWLGQYMILRAFVLDETPPKSTAKA